MGITRDRRFYGDTSLIPGNPFPEAGAPGSRLRSRGGFPSKRFDDASRVWRALVAQGGYNEILADLRLELCAIDRAVWTLGRLLFHAAPWHSAFRETRARCAESWATEADALPLRNRLGDALPSGDHDGGHGVVPCLL